MLARPILVQRVKIDVGKQRTEHSALRCAFVGQIHLVLLEDAALEPASDQALDPLIPHALLHKLDEQILIDGVKVGADVGVDHGGVAVSHPFAHRAQAC